MSPRSTLLLCLILALAAAAWFGLVRPRHTASDTPVFLTTEAESGDIVRRVIASGTLNPLRSIQVGSQISGVILDLPADFNTVVRRGDVVARIDTATFEAAVRLAEAELESALAAAEFQRIQAARVRDLAARDLVSPVERESVEVNLRQAEAAVRIREEHLERARLELARCTIVSPADGIVISRNVDVGQTVAASLSAPVLFEIAEDLSRMMINARIPEADIGSIAVGQSVEFRVDAYRDQLRRGSVVQVRKAPVIDNNVVTYDTIIHVDNPDLSLHPGMTAEVAVVTAERLGVTRVRNSALRALLPVNLRPAPPDAAPGEARLVYRLNDPANPASLVAVPVVLGLADLTHTEVISGLNPGEVLVTGLAPRRAADTSSGGSLLRGNQARY